MPFGAPRRSQVVGSEDTLQQLQASTLVIGMPRQGEEVETFAPGDVPALEAKCQGLGVEVITVT